jgi:hypothetical protein
METSSVWMMIYSVFTPYYSEDVIYSPQQLAKENDDGISMMYYLRTIVPGMFLALDRWNASWFYSVFVCRDVAG